MLKVLSISRFGVPFDGKAREGAICRLKSAPQLPFNCPYLVVSEDVNEPADIVMIKDFNKVKKQLKKKVKKGTGLELIVNPARKMDGSSLGKWFKNLADLNTFCHLARCQFILSSGATSEYEMISGPSLDAILKTAGIEPRSHWISLGKWLEAKLSRNVTYA